MIFVEKKILIDVQINNFLAHVEQVNGYFFAGVLWKLLGCKSFR